jgi:hypothetical protein
MPNYDFTELSPIDFEILVRDLLQEERKIRLESFKPGKDGGIDFRYCRNRSHKLIVQCKHYAQSSFSSLYSEMKSELEKVKRLNPTSYVLATSLPLSDTQKAKLESLLTPFVRRPGDIYGKDDINNLLGQFDKIERRTFKLWLASVPAFEEILNSRVKNFSRDSLNRIKEHAKYYVQNESFSEALEILSKHNFCIVAGIPGIGKTILAEMLLLHFVNAHYDAVKIYSDISEAAALDYMNHRRIFYYDDFLGQTASLEKLGKNEDQKLLDFIATIRKSRVSKLVLTTREYILNQARSRYEKLARSDFKLETCVIDLSKYTRLNRAKILFNHLYFSDLSHSFKNTLLSNRNYLTIVDHPNYNPRIVELMTESSRLSEVSSSKYFDYFVENLENPLLVWRHAFDHQLSLAAKNLLIVVASMPSQMFLEDCREAFDSFHRNQGRSYGFQVYEQDFMDALKEVDGNFLRTERAKAGTLVAFHNPSVQDFMSHYLVRNGDLLRAILESATFHDQAAWVWRFAIQMLENSTLERFLINNEARLIDSLRRTIQSRSCYVGNIRSGREVYKGRWMSSVEERATLIAEVVGRISSQSSMNLLIDVIQIVRQRIQQGQADHDNLLYFLKKLRLLKLLKSPQATALIAESKLFFMRKPVWVRHLETFFKFQEEFPTLVTSEDQEQVRRALIEVVDETVKEHSSDPDEVREEIEIIQTLAEKLDVEVRRQVSYLESCADNLDSFVPLDDLANDKPSPTEDLGCKDEEIDSLFGMLAKT